MTVASGPRTDRDVRTAPDEDHEEVDRESTPDPPGERRRFPSAFTVLAAVTIAVWVLAFIVPTGQYSTDSETGRPIARSEERRVGKECVRTCRHGCRLYHSAHKNTKLRQ